MRRKKNFESSELGIHLESLRERELFRWFLASLLFGNPIQREIARQAFVQLDRAGLNSPRAIVNAGWDRLVELLDQAHYVRYDFSTATKLLNVCKALLARYGAVKPVIAESATPVQAGKTLQEFKGIGPVTARIFLREIRPLWHVLKVQTTTGSRTMNREPRRIPPKLQQPAQKRRAGKDVAALPKKSRAALAKAGKKKTAQASPSQPHSKFYGR